jgi:hypothetical protein
MICRRCARSAFFLKLANLPPQVPQVPDGLASGGDWRLLVGRGGGGRGGDWCDFPKFPKFPRGVLLAAEGVICELALLHNFLGISPLNQLWNHTSIKCVGCE